MRLNIQKALKHSIFLAMPILLLASINSSFAKASSASVNSLAGYVTITEKNGDIKRLAELDSLSEGGIVTTGSKSSISITLANGEIIELGESDTYTIPAGENTDNNAFAQRSLSKKSPTLSTATSAGGRIETQSPAPTVPTPGGSPSN